LVRTPHASAHRGHTGAVPAVTTDEINAEVVGRRVAAFAGGQIKLELRNSLPAIRLDRR
jgi:hypothetical protein